MAISPMCKDHDCLWTINCGLLNCVSAYSLRLSIIPNVFPPSQANKPGTLRNKHSVDYTELVL